MPFQISTEPGGLHFSADPDQTILEAALAAGFLLPYGCRDGACGTCKAQVISGEIEAGPIADNVLDASERAAGQTLLCQARARSDVVLKVRDLGRVGDIPIKKLPCRVASLERAASDVMIVTVKLPASEPFRFRAGQYIDFLLKNGRRRSFSIATPPEQPDHLELHVRKIEGGAFTTQVFETMQPRDILRFEGPLGTFFLREPTGRPIILLAGGTGFAPLKSIIEHLIQTGERRDITLYWGARRREGLYLDALARSWENTLPGFRYIPVLSEAGDDDDWHGRRGLVHTAVLTDHPDLSGHELYACGAPAMIEAARHDFLTIGGLQESYFHSDAFTLSTDPTP